MPRIPPITGKSDIPAEHHHLVDMLVKQYGAVRGPFSVLLHTPELMERIVGVGDYFRDHSVVEGKDRSLAILAGVRERKSAYVWSAQVNAARRAGLREEAIDVVRGKKDLSTLTAEEREIYTYARQLVRDNRVDQAAFDALLKRHDARWLVELTVIVNHFGVLCGVVNAFEVAAPEDGDKLP